MSIAIVTDTACNITPEMAEEQDIYLLPLEIIFGNTTYKEGYDLPGEAFYEKIVGSEAIPTTSQPAAVDAIELYEKLIEEYDQVLSIHIDERLSGTVQTLTGIAKEVDSEKITVIDSGLVTVPATYLVLEAKRLADGGATVEAIIGRMEKMREHTKAFATLNSMEYLLSGGRFAALAGNIVKWMKIKPIISVKSDSLKFLGTSRTGKRALAKLEKNAVEYIDGLDFPVTIDVGYGNNLEVAKNIQATLLEKYPENEINLIRISSVIGVHTGPEVIGIAIAPNYTK